MATWNVENLSGTHGTSLFAGRSYERTERDYDALRKYVLETSADVVLLQEVASPDAMRQILPAKYHFFISSEYFKADPGESGIYTGIAYDPSAVRIINTVSIPTGITYQGTDGSQLRARDSVGIQVGWGEARVWIVSVHLKSSCSNKSLPSSIKATDCGILYQQLAVLRTWITRLRADGSWVIIGGDFNRRGYPDYAQDPYLGLLDSAADAKRFARPDQRTCSTFDGNNRDPIDYFILFGLDNKRVQVKELSIHERDLQAGFKLSDHCPVVLQVPASQVN